MRRFRYLPFIVVAILTLFATMGCDPEEPELVATAVPTDNPTSTTDLSAPTPTTTATHTPTPSLVPTVSPKISQGLGVSRHELEALFSQPEWGFSFRHVAGGGQREPRSVGEIEGIETFALLLIGPPENLFEVRTVFTLDFDQPDASLGITLYLVELLASVLPTWSNSDEWLADAMDALVGGAEEVETTHGVAVVRVNLGGSIDVPILDMTIQSRRATMTATPAGTVAVPVAPSEFALDESPTTTPMPTVIQTPQPTPTWASTPTPTREPTPTPEPTPVVIGTTVVAGGSSYTLNEVRDPAPPGIFGVTEGKRLIALDITQVGTSDDGDDFNALYFAVQDSDGYVYGPELAGADVEPQFGSGELATGQIVRGWVVFELPETSRLVSVMVEAEVFGSRITITEFTQDQAGDLASQTLPPVPLPPSSPVVIGTAVEAGGSSYTLNEVKDPAPPGIFGVTEGKRLIALDITQVGTSDDGDDFNALYFAVQDSDGYVYGPELAGADVEPQFGSGELATGQIVRGWVVFELPETSRLVSVMVEAEVFGSRITITEFTQDQAGDLASQTLPPVPLPPSSPVVIGTAVEAGGSSYTLNEVKDPAPPGIFGVTEGKRLIALDITQVGTSDDGDDFNALYFAVQDSDGYVYGPELAGADVEPQFGSGELAAGQVVRGWVVFELPETSRLVSSMVEAEVFGSRTTIADLIQSQTSNGVITPTPIAEAEVVSTMQMKVTDSSGNHISTMEQWRPLVRPQHWKKGHSAYSLADFILNRQGAAYMASSISSVLSQPIRLEQGTPEYAAKFDRYSGPARLDIGISGQAGAKQNLFVGVEAKVNEPFGSETVCERYNQAIEYLSSNPRSKAVARVKELLSLYLGDTDEPCESRFAEVGYELLTAAAGTIAQHKDVSVFYVAVFKTGEFDEGKGDENRLDYENFINLAGGERLMRNNEVSLSHEMDLNGRRLICIYEYFNAEA